MNFFKHQNINKRSHTYTLFIIPGKYGTSKSISIPRWIILVPLLIFLTIITALILLFSDYTAVKKLNDKNLKNIRLLNEQNSVQKKELESYKKIEDELLYRLEQLKDIENQLKSRFNSSSEINSSSVVTASTNHVNLMEIDMHINSIKSLISMYDKKMSEEKRIPYILPCSGKITSYFGTRANPISSRGKAEVHHGIDISNSYRTPIKASADGIVTYAGWLNSYGYTVIINHGNGYESLYGHNLKLLVKKNQTVKRGQTISLMGSTGRSTGTHVHFEVRLNSNAVNPLKISKEEIYNVQ